MVWVNDNVIRANGVFITDPPPEGMTMYGAPTCTPYGSTTVDSCNYEAPSAAFPRGRVLIQANFGPDFGVTVGTIGQAANRLEIAFDVLVDRPEAEVTYENQGTAEWTPPEVDETFEAETYDLTQLEGLDPDLLLSDLDPETVPPDESPVTPSSRTDLGLTKTVDNATPFVGGEVTFSLTVFNQGPDSATAVQVIDLLPSGYSYRSAVPSVGRYDATTGIWVIGAMDVGDSVTLDLSAEVLAEGEYTNRATVRGRELDPNPDDNTDTVTLEPVEPPAESVADLELIKTVDEATPAVGEVVNFTLTVLNQGPATATGVKVVERLPSGYGYVAATASRGDYDAVGGVWTIGALTVDERVTLVLQARVLSTGDYANRATVIGNEPDPNPDDNTDTVTPEPVAPEPGSTADLVLSKTVDVAAPAVGEVVTFTLTVLNQGPATATGVNVVERLPSGYDYVASTPSQGVYDAATGAWAIGTLANGAHVTLTLRARVLSTGDYANQATVIGREPDPNPDDNTDTVTPEPVAPEPGSTADLVLSKTVDVAAPAVGEVVTFTLTVLNQGPATATGVNVVERLPSGYDYVASTPSQGVYDAATGAWAIGTLANGAHVTLTLRARVLSTGDYANQATVIGREPDPNPDDNTDTVTPEPVAPEPGSTADLVLSKTVDVAAPAVGEVVTFTLTVLNQGPATATGVNVVERLPSGYDYVASTPSQGVYDAATGAWAIGTLANGAHVTLTLRARVLSTGDYANQATVIGREPDPNPDDNTDTVTPEPVAPEPGSTADLVLSKTVDVAAPAVGEVVTFTLTVLNQGPATATGVNVVERLPSGYDYVASTPSQGVYDAATGAWAIGTLANGAHVTLTLRARVLSTGDYANQATVIGREPDPNPDDNTDTVTPEPVAPEPGSTADLVLSKTVDVAAPAVGEVVTFTLTVLNQGPATATGVNVVERLPSGYDYVASTPSQGVYDAATGAWAIGTLANGAHVTLTLRARVLSTGDYANQATVIGREPDPNPDDNTDTVTPEPVAPEPGSTADLVLSKTVDVAAPAVGEVVTFTLTVLNQGPATATGVNVVERLPSGYDYVASTPSQGVYDAATGAWAIGTLANGAHVTLTLRARVLSTGDYANQATVIGREPDPNPDDNTDTVTPEPVAPEPGSTADLVLSKTVDVAAPAVGEVVTFTLTVLNQGPATATGVNVVERLPSGYDYVASTPSQGVYDAATGAWAIGTLANGAHVTLTLRARVLSTGDYANQATVIGREPDPNPDDNTDTVTPEPAVPPPTQQHSIPTLSEWAMLLLLALMLLLGLRYQRRY
jgi:large repetitive protein